MIFLIFYFNYFTELYYFILEFSLNMKKEKLSGCVALCFLVLGTALIVISMIFLFAIFPTLVNNGVKDVSQFRRVYFILTGMMSEFHLPNSRKFQTFIDFTFVKSNSYLGLLLRHYYYILAKATRVE